MTSNKTVAGSQNDNKSHRGTLHDAVDRARIEPTAKGAGKRVRPGLSATHKGLARVLIGTTGPDGWSWLGLVKLGLRSGLCRRSVETALRDMRAKGWVVFGEHALTNGGSVRAYKVTPVVADLMTDEEIAAVVATDREATRKRQVARRDRTGTAKTKARGDVTASPTVTPVTATVTVMSRQDLPVGHGNTIRTVTASAAADPSGGFEKECECDPVAPDPTPHTPVATLTADQIGRAHV